ncbi:S-layer homology domain-containing protein [Paenibacillus sp. P25]|nr:S-layer homology domain-containing protein [Paenibacillus sp. P25]
MHFTDTQGHWASNVIEDVYRHHIIEGYPDGTFKPNASMIRSEAVTMINRSLYRGPLMNAEVTFPDMTPEHWAFGQVEESAVTHESNRNPDASETMTKLIPEPLW